MRPRPAVLSVVLCLVLAGAVAAAPGAEERSGKGRAEVLHDRWFILLLGSERLGRVRSFAERVIEKGRDAGGHRKDAENILAEIVEDVAVPL